MPFFPVTLLFRQISAPSPRKAFGVGAVLLSAVSFTRSLLELSMSHIQSHIHVYVLLSKCPPTLRQLGLSSVYHFIYTVNLSAALMIAVAAYRLYHLEIHTLYRLRCLQELFRFSTIPNSRSPGILVLSYSGVCPPPQPPPNLTLL